MNKTRYFVEQQGKTVFITKGTTAGVVRIFRTEESMVTYICNSIYDATNMAEVLLEGQTGIIKNECDDIFVYVDHVKTACPEMKYPCHVEE